MLQGLGDSAVDVREVDKTAQQMSGLCVCSALLTGFKARLCIPLTSPLS